MAGRQRKPSMYDVAALAGVSHQTVSRVLNNHPSIRETTRAKVIRAIEQVNYTPNAMARALATNRTHRIGVLIDGAGHYGPNTALRGFEEAARAEGYSVDAVSVGETDDPAAGVEQLLLQGAEALCVIAPRIPSLESVRAVMRDLPVLVVTAGSAPDRLTVAVDQRAGARLAVEHLLALGHRDILHLAGPEDWLDALARLEAWEQRLAEAGLATRAPVIGDWTADFGYDYGYRSPEIDHATAIFVANDQMALGVIHGLHDRGLRVPQDISIVGFDDNPESRHFLPPLTTVRQDFHALGTLSVTQLIAAIRGVPVPQADLIAPELVVRQSTAARG
ncbi:MAG: LacI family DNA-binding transcriptional regulator [Actinobacteria bacterium]|nr:LacI family DNA-binding transcriptional regulator [Actinomycetota bacterium]